MEISKDRMILQSDFPALQERLLSLPESKDKDFRDGAIAAFNDCILQDFTPCLYQLASGYLAGCDLVERFYLEQKEANHD